MILLLIRFFAAVIAAWVVGKLVAKLKLPAILGWLLGGGCCLDRTRSPC